MKSSAIPSGVVSSSKKNSKFGAAVMSKCIKCSENIFSFDEIAAINNTYHKKCFTCIDCKKQLLFDTFKVFEDQPYCSGCYYKYRQGGKISPRSGNVSPRPKPQSSSSSSSQSSSLDTSNKLTVNVNPTVINVNNDSVPSPSKNNSTNSPNKDNSTIDISDNISKSPPRSPNKVGVRLTSTTPQTPSPSKLSLDVLSPPPANATESEKIIYFLRSPAKPFVTQPPIASTYTLDMVTDRSSLVEPVTISSAPSSSSPFHMIAPPLSPVTPNNASVQVQHKQLAQRDSTKMFVDEQLSMFYAYYKKDNNKNDDVMNENENDHIPSPHSPVRNVRANPSKKSNNNMNNNNHNLIDTSNNSDSDSTFERRNAELLEEEQLLYQQQLDLEALQESELYENQLNSEADIQQQQADKEARELSVRLALFRQQESIQQELELVKALQEKEEKEQLERIKEEQERQLLLDQQATVWADNKVSPRTTNNDLIRQPSQATMEIAKWRDKKKKLKQQKMEALKGQETILEKMTVIQSKKRSNTLLYMEVTGTVGTGSIYGNMYDSRNTMHNSNIHGSSTLRLVHNNNSPLRQSPINTPGKPSTKAATHYHTTTGNHNHNHHNNNNATDDLDDLLSSLDIQHVTEQDRHHHHATPTNGMMSARVAEDMTVDSIEEEDEALCRALDEEALMLAEIKKWEEQVNAELAEAEKQEQQAKLLEEQERNGHINATSASGAVVGTATMSVTNSAVANTSTNSNNRNHPTIVAPSSPLRKGTLGGGPSSSPVRSRSSSQMFDDKMRETKFKTSHAVHVGSVGNSNNDYKNNNSNHNSSCSLDNLEKKGSVGNNNSREGSPMKKNASNHLGNSSHSINSSAHDSDHGRDSDAGNHSPLKKQMSFQVNNSPARTGSNKFVNPMASRVNNMNTIHNHNDSAVTVTTMRQTFSGGSHDNNDDMTTNNTITGFDDKMKKNPPPPAAAASTSSSSSSSVPKKGLGRLTNFVRSKLLGKDEINNNNDKKNTNDKNGRIHEEDDSTSRPSLFSYLSPRNTFINNDEGEGGRESESGGGGNSNNTTRQTFTGLFKRTKSKL